MLLNFDPFWTNCITGMFNSSQGLGPNIFYIENWSTFIDIFAKTMKSWSVASKFWNKGQLDRGYQISPSIRPAEVNETARICLADISI